MDQHSSTYVYCQELKKLNRNKTKDKSKKCKFPTAILTLLLGGCAMFLVCFIKSFYAVKWGGTEFLYNHEDEDKFGEKIKKIYKGIDEVRKACQLDP
ncbi:hypothetical protein HEP_00001900 [Hepatocystis sp. ex Piliocolobus tephrosceles]|nr:hypothetical protein HEP_00001900 [Hepatocystis sp. ex Piliocolobus tephrosceles]